MQVINHLPAIAAYVKNKFIPNETHSRGDILGGIDQARNEIGVIFLQIGDRFNMLLWNHQNMNRGRRPNIAERLDRLIFEDRVRWYNTLGYFAK